MDALPPTQPPKPDVVPSRGRGRRIVAIVALCLVASACTWWLRGKTVWTDGESIRVADGVGAVREVTWGKPQPLGREINTPDQEYEPAVSPDGNELYFVRGKAAKNADLHVAHRTVDGWSEPIPLDAVNSPADDLGPRVTADGRFLLFYSDRAGGLGGYDLWAAPRLAGASGEWGVPFNLGPAVNSPFDEYSPAPTPDGGRLFFATNRTAAQREQKEPWRATIRAANNGDFDLWVASVDANAAGAAPPSTQTSVADAPESDGADFGAADSATQPSSDLQAAKPQPTVRTLAFAAAREVPGVNTPFHEGASCMSPAGDFLYFASNRTGGSGKFDLYRCRINAATGKDGTFGAVENLGPTINTPDNEADPQLALGGFRLYLSSDRPSRETRANGSATQPSDAAVGYDLLQSDSREVFAQRQGRPLPNLGFGGWWLVASALVLIPLLLYMRNWDDRHLNILQKALLVSLLIHLGLTFWFNFIPVTSKIVDYVKRETGMTEVTIDLDPSTASRESDIGAAIREQAANDLPGMLAPQGELTRADPGAPAVAPPAAVQVNAPTAGVGAQPLAMEAAAAKIDVPMVAPPVNAQPVVRPDASAVDVRIAATPPRLTQADAAPQAMLPVASAPKLDLPNAPQAAPSQVHVDMTPTVARPDSMAEVVGAPRPVVPAAGMVPIAPTAPMPTAGAAPTVQGPAQVMPRVVEAPSNVPTPAETLAGAARQGTEIAGAAGPAEVRTHVPTAVAGGVGAGQSIAATPGVGATPAVEAMAGVAGVKPLIDAGNAGASNAPTVSPMTPTVGRVTGAGPEGPAAAEVAVGSQRQGNAAVAAVGAATDVKASVPTVGAAGASLVEGGGLAPHVNANPAASVAAAAAGVPAPGVSSELAMRPEVVGPRPGAVPVSSGRPDAPEASEVAAGVLRQGGAGASGPSGAGEIRTSVPTAGPAGESLASAAAASSGSHMGAGARSPGANVPAVATSGMGAPVAGLNIDMRPSATRRRTDDASPLAAAGDGALAPTTRPAAFAGGPLAGVPTAPASIQTSVAPVGSAGESAVQAAAPKAFAGPAGGGAGGPAVVASATAAASGFPAQPASELKMQGPQIGAQPVNGGGSTDAPRAVEVTLANQKAGPPGNVASDPVGVGGPTLAPGVPPAASVQAGGGNSLASAATVGARAVSIVPVVGPAGAGLPGVGGPQIDLPKIAASPKPGAGGGSPMGTGAEPGGGPDGGALAASSGKQSTDPKLEPRRPQYASIDVPAIGNVPGPGSGGSGGLTPNGAIGPRASIGTTPSVSPDVTIAQPKLTAPDSLFQRSAEQRKPLIEKMGGTDESEQAVARGLAYLARQQEPDGRWTHVTDDGKPGKRAKSAHDMAFTGLSTLAFLANDHSPAKDGPYRETVTRGIEYLIENQRADGDLRGHRSFLGEGSSRAGMYDHGIATMALAEAALMTGDNRIAAAAKRGADFIVASQHPKTGGWRYVPGDPGDTSVFGWQLLALHNVEQLGYRTPDETRERARKFVRSVSQGKNKVLAGYQVGRAHDRVMTAEALFCRMLLDEPITDDAAREVSQYLTADMPSKNGLDLYYWYYASLSLSQMQNDAWRKWNVRTRDLLVGLQKKGGAADGSWVEDRYAGRVGRIYTTALATLTLEVYYRYLPLHPDNAGKGNGAAEEPPTPKKPRQPDRPRQVLEPS